MGEGYITMRKVGGGGRMLWRIRVRGVGWGRRQMGGGREEFGSVCWGGGEFGSVCWMGGGRSLGQFVRWEREQRSLGQFVRWEREGRSLGQSHLEAVQSGSSVNSGLELFSGRMTSICLVFCRMDCQLQSPFLALHLLHSGVGRYVEFTETWSLWNLYNTSSQACQPYYCSVSYFRESMMVLMQHVWHPWWCWHRIFGD